MTEGGAEPPPPRPDGPPASNLNGAIPMRTPSFTFWQSLAAKVGGASAGGRAAAHRDPSADAMAAADQSGGTGDAAGDDGEASGQSPASSDLISW